MNHWKDIRARQLIPPTHLAIPEAFEIIGRHHFGPSGQWTGAETDYEDLGPEPARPKLVFDGDSDRIKDAGRYNRDLPRVLDLLGLPGQPHLSVSNDQWCRASDRWRLWESSAALVCDRRSAVFWIMHRLGMSPSPDRGLGYCYIDSKGDIRELDVSQWRCAFEVACDRFEHAALCTAAAYAMHRPDPWCGGRGYLEHFTLPIFVNQTNLAMALDGIPAFDAEASRLAAIDPSAHVVDSFIERRAKQTRRARTAHVEEAAASHPVISESLIRSRRTGGPKPRRWEPTLMRIFRANHDEIVPLSQRDLRDFVHRKWPSTMRDKPSSAVSIDKHRQRYLADCARTAREPAHDAAH